MPELNFKGKEFVYNHHLSVPFRPLEPDVSKSIGDGSLDGNQIIHGDNLHALKSLLPAFGGKVDCIYIDPPLQHRQGVVELQRQRQQPDDQGMAERQSGDNRRLPPSR